MMGTCCGSTRSLTDVLCNRLSRLNLAFPGVVVLAALAGCGAKPEPATPSATTDSTPVTSATAVGSNPSPTQSATIAPSPGSEVKPVAQTTSTSTAAPSKPAQEEVEVANFDPGDSGQFQLGAHHVLPVLNANRPYLARYCWAPAVNKNPNGPKKVKIPTEVEVKPDGTVSKVKVVNNESYPEMAPCMERHLKKWKFPKAKGTSSLLFPIGFERSEVEVVEKPAEEKKK